MKNAHHVRSSQCFRNKILVKKIMLVILPEILQESSSESNSCYSLKFKAWEVLMHHKYLPKLSYGAYKSTKAFMYDRTGA